MQNNIFKFEDTYWIQLTWTEMVTLTVCNYATLYFYLHELTNFSKYQDSYLLLLCYIDVGIIVCAVNNADWLDFQNTSYSFGILK